MNFYTYDQVELANPIVLNNVLKYQNLLRIIVSGKDRSDGVVFPLTTTIQRFSSITNKIYQYYKSRHRL